MSDKNVGRAYRAAWTLVDHPQLATTLLRNRLHPVHAVESKRLDRLILDLDSNQLSVRQQATVDLETLAEVAEPALRKSLEAKPSLEMKQRVEKLLDRLKKRKTASEWIRQVRAIQVLEHAGTLEAHQLLQSLADGEPRAWLTREAKASLLRLARQKEVDRGQ